jgi:hypothetical protein
VETVVWRRWESNPRKVPYASWRFVHEAATEVDLAAYERDADRAARIRVQWPYVWFWRAKHGHRKASAAAWARGAMNSIGVEFPDGVRAVTARHAVRRRM